MSVPGTTHPARPRPAVFLSYASEDRPAAQALRDALLTFGLEVLYDESSLVGGDAWDQKIRRQIRQCDFFMALISRNTEARAEGYFRREWRLAVERTLDMADDHIFLLPVVIDDTSEAHARVPDKFLTVQWLRVPGGKPNSALEELCGRLVSSATAVATAPAAHGADPRPGPDPSSPQRSRTRRVPAEYPPFPHEEPGQRTRFWFQVVGWTLRWAWISFNRLPNWVRICVYVWIGITVLARWGELLDGSRSDHHTPASDHLSASDAQKLKQIADGYQGNLNKLDIAKLATQIAREFSDDDDPGAAARSPLLAIPFSAPAGDTAGDKIADSSFAQVYGRIAISHHGHVGLTSDAPASLNASAAAAQGRAHHAKYVLYGAVDGPSPDANLTVSIVAAADGAVLWSKSYPVASADPAKIAAEVQSEVPAADDDD